MVGVRMKPYPWQNMLWQQLQAQRQQQRLPHALVFYGPEGLGKQHFAFCFAQALLCHNNRPDGTACGTCKGCHLFLAESHSDFYAVTPLEKSKTIKIEQIRHLTDKLSETAMQRGKQVAVIFPAETMNRACSNALLKTLEEPVGDTVIILVANQLGSIPETILSRCQKLYFNTPSREQTVPWVSDHLHIDSIEANRLLHLSCGAPQLAIKMQENKQLELRDQVLHTLQQLLQGQAWVSEASKPLLEHDVSRVLQIIFSLTLDLLRIRLGIAQHQLENQDKFIMLQRISAKTNLSQLADQLPQLLQAKERVKSMASINLALLVEGTLLRWIKIGEAVC